MFGPQVRVDSSGGVSASIAYMEPRKEFKNKVEQQIALVYSTYELVRKRIASLDMTGKHAAILGGINIKVDGAPDIFQPLVFRVHEPCSNIP